MGKYSISPMKIWHEPLGKQLIHWRVISHIARKIQPRFYYQYAKGVLRRALDNLSIVMTSNAAAFDKIVFRKDGIKQYTLLTACCDMRYFIIYLRYHRYDYMCIMLLLGLVSHSRYIYMFGILLLGMATHHRYVYV